MSTDPLLAELDSLLGRDSAASGKSDDGGEALPPFGLRAGAVVNVVSVSTGDFGVDICGGRIGQGSTFCLASPATCTVASHANKVQFDGVPTGAQVLAICVPASGGSKALTSPVLDISKITEPAREELSGTARPVEEWKHIFATLPDSRRPPPKVGFSSLPAHTPRKLRHRYMDEDASPSSGDLVEVPLEWPKAPPTKETWPAVTAKVNALTASIHDLNEDFGALSLKVGGDMDRLEDIVDLDRSKVQQALGSPPPDKEGMPVWEALKEHTLEFARESANEVELLRKVADSVIVDVLRRKLIPHINAKVDEVRAELGPKRGASDGGERGGHDEQEECVQITRATYEQLRRAVLDVNELKASVGRLREEMSVDAVLMGGYTFNSPHDCALFLDKHDGYDAVIKMFDIVSLLQAACFGNEGTKESLDFDQKASKSSYKSSAEAIYVKSFGLSLPEIFGKVDTAQSAAKPGLPGVKSFRDWDAQCEEAGLVHYIQDCVNKFVQAMDQELEDSTFSELSTEVRAVAKAMLATSNTWLISMIGFVNKYYHDLVNGGESKEEEVWSHVSQCLRVMFRLISKVRTRCSTRIGGCYDSKRRAPALMWGALQAHLLMKEYVDHQFKNHPSIAPVLTRHLFAHRQSKLEAKATNEKVKSLESSVKNLKSAFDKKPWKN